MGSNILKISLDPNGQLDVPDNHGYYYSKRISDPNTMVYRYLQVYYLISGMIIKMKICESFRTQNIIITSFGCLMAVCITYKSGQYKHLNYNVTYWKHLEMKKMAEYLLTTYNGQNKYV